MYLILFNPANNNILLFFNRISNDFGTNWVQGVCFTILIGFITFVLMAISSGLMFNPSPNAFLNSLEYFLKIINILDLKPFDKESNNPLFKDINPLTMLIFFIGRIFIGYGYYQTIQAFRKYGKS